ncbi:MAG: hypothetical protein OXH59_18450 [Rhodospirillaceae bacterium]|nr:hypothetical protein [Rhodospirillaceae bacterium]
MADTVDVSRQFGAVPLGPPRDKRTIDISTADHVDEGGFVCQAEKAGNLTYRTAAGEADQTEAVTAGAVIQVCGVPVLLVAVRASATIGSIVIGKL